VATSSLIDFFSYLARDTVEIYVGGGTENKSHFFMLKHRHVDATIVAYSIWRGIVRTTLDHVIPDESKTNILDAKPLNGDSKISAMPHIPSVSASAMLGESSSTQNC
jgi:hypothetical protein